MPDSEPRSLHGHELTSEILLKNDQHFAVINRLPYPRSPAVENTVSVRKADVLLCRFASSTAHLLNKSRQSVWMSGQGMEFFEVYTLAED